MGDPEIRREGAEGSGIFQNVPACDRYLTSTELSTPIKEDTVLTWPELPVPIGKSNYKAPEASPAQERVISGL